MLIFIYYSLRHKVFIITKTHVNFQNMVATNNICIRLKRFLSSIIVPNWVETGRRSDTLEAILDTWYGKLTVAAYLIIIVTLTIPSHCHEGIRNRDSVGTDELVTFKEVHHGQMTEDNRML